MSFEVFGKLLAGARTPSAHTDLGLQDLTIDIAQRRVMRGGDCLDVKDLNFAVFQLLLERAPAIVSPGALAEAWPVRHVSEATVAKRIALLRSALGETAANGRYIETVRGQGYRLRGDLRVCAPNRSAWGRRAAALVLGAVVCGQLAASSVGPGAPAGFDPVFRTLVDAQTGAVLTVRDDANAITAPHVLVDPHSGDVVILSVASRFPATPLRVLADLATHADQHGLSDDARHAGAYRRALQDLQRAPIVVDADTTD